MRGKPPLPGPTTDGKHYASRRCHGLRYDCFFKFLPSGFCLGGGRMENHGFPSAREEQAGHGYAPWGMDPGDIVFQFDWSTSLCTFSYPNSFHFSFRINPASSFASFAWSASIVRKTNIVKPCVSRYPKHIDKTNECYFPLTFFWQRGSLLPSSRFRGP